METSRALAIVLRELEGHALAEARVRLAQVEAEAAAKVAAAEARAEEFQDQYEVCAANARFARSGAEAQVRRITEHYESIVDDLWLGNKALREECDALRERVRELTKTNGMARKKTLKSVRRQAVKESAYSTKPDA